MELNQNAYDGIAQRAEIHLNNNNLLRGESNKLKVALLDYQYLLIKPKYT